MNGMACMACMACMAGIGHSASHTVHLYHWRWLDPLIKNLVLASRTIEANPKHLKAIQNDSQQSESVN